VTAIIVRNCCYLSCQQAYTQARHDVYYYCTSTEVAVNEIIG